jgi:hypothetical protein
MTSKLISELLERQGILPLLAMRERGSIPKGPETHELLSACELLALGAAADIARRRERGDEARIYVPTAPAAGEGVVVMGASEPTRGTAFLRRVATLRLTGPIGLSIVVDWGALGLEIAQVALSFGATDLAGPIASRRGLPMLDLEDQKKLVKRREIAGFVERAGFRPVFVAKDASPALSKESVDASSSSRAHVES